MSGSRRLATVVFAVIGLLLAIQLVPYGRDHSRPADGAQPAWDSPRTQQLAERACNDCHSNKTRWPWYSAIAPISWRIQNHVQEGREKLNFSAFDPAKEDVAEAAGEAGETVTKKEMPPFDYLLAHPEARLTAEERAALASGLDRTFAAFAEKEKGKGGAGSPGTGSSERDEDEGHEREHERGRDRDGR
jgi:mono/diheme cytochrome c family protein